MTSLIQQEIDRRNRTNPLTTALPAGPKTPARKEGFDLNLVPEGTRSQVREFVEGQGPVIQFLMETAPAAIGTFIGGVGGTVLGPGGTVAGGAAGGVIGEQVGQELGVSPRSSAALALAGAGPVAGKAVGSALRLGRKGIGKAVSAAPPTKAAMARRALRDAATEFESFGTQILGQQRGLMRTKASTLYKIAEEATVNVPRFSKATIGKVFNPLKGELARYAKHPDVDRAIKLLNSLESTLSGQMTFGDLIAARKITGAAVRQAEKATGVKFGTAAQVFKGLANGIDFLETLGGKVGRLAAISKGASKRARLDFAVKDLDDAVTRFTKYVPGEDALILDPKGLQKWLRMKVNPKSSRFDKNFTAALGDDIGKIEARLIELTKHTTTNPGGPGSLVIRGRGAQTGAIVGGFIAGGPGAAFGTLAGANAPEILTGILSSPRASAALIRMAKFGEGTINEQMWMALGQMAAQGLK